MSVQQGSIIDDSDVEFEVGQVEEEDDSEDSDHSPERDVVKAQFDEDIKEMNQLLKMHSKGSQQDEEQLKDNLKLQLNTFIRDRAMWWEDLHRLTARQQNFLHYLAYYGQKTGRDTTYFHAKIIRRLLDIGAMGSTDSSHRTPLTVAIQEGNWAFFQGVCLGLNVKHHKVIGEQLQCECQRLDMSGSTGLNCLQSAIDLFPCNANNGKAILKMMDFVPKEMFKITDAQGRTPLHISVEYKRSTATQYRIVEKLIEKGADALKIKMLNDHGGHTVCKLLQTPTLNFLPKSPKFQVQI